MTRGADGSSVDGAADGGSSPKSPPPPAGVSGRVSGGSAVVRVPPGIGIGIGNGIGQDDCWPGIGGDPAGGTICVIAMSVGVSPV